MKKLLIGAFAALLAVPSLTGCGGEEKQELTVKTDSIPAVDSSQLEDEVFYQIPTPNELFGIIKQIGGKGNQGILHKVDMGGKYSDMRQKAMNFGIYSADLAYSRFKVPKS